VVLASRTSKRCSLGVNVAGAAAFDYNVNQGSNEISDVDTIEYDQINTGETLTVNNIVKTAGATGADIATLLWDNEAGSTAGRVVANFRSSAVAGATTVNVQLDDVQASKANLATGVLDIGGGVETIVITSQGTSRNTLNTAIHGDGFAADIASASADGVNDNGALTKVVVKGAQALGLAPGVITNDDVGETNFGLTNHVINSDLGLNNAQASASNLASVQATVTEIDATAADGGVAMSFVSRQDGAAVNTTFKGGKAADFVVFQRGNVNGTGGEGADTFVFANGNLTNFDFGSADTLAGGTGSDTVILGMNGVGTVTANTTEFNNKAGIEVLDLRGATNTVTLADAFVAGVDVGTFTVRTDRIVQSAASEANPTPSNATNNAARENNSINTVVLTELADNRAITFIGGSGSDRLVVDNASANQFTSLDGGTNAAVNSQDSLTVVNTSVLDDRDVANIKNFEFVNLVENVVANSTFNLSLTEAFVLANSNGMVIGSTSNTYGVRIGAGDVVNLEISDLLNGAVLKSTLTARTINVQDLIAAGATVNFQQNGVTVSTNAAPAALAAFAVTGTAPAATTTDDVPGATASLQPVTATNTAAVITGNATALTGGTGNNDTLTVSDAGTVTVGSVTTAFENLVLANGTNTVTFAQAGFTNITGGTGNDSVNMANLALNASASLGQGVDTLQTSGVLTGGTLNGGDGADTMTLTAAANLAAATISGFETLNNGGFNVSLTAAQLNNFTTAVNGGGVVTTTTAGTALVSTASTSTVFALANGTNDFTFNAAVTHNITGGTGADTITLGSLNAADTVNGGTGVDTLNIANDAGAIIANQLSNIEVINFTVAQAGATTVTLTSNVTAATGEGSLTVNATGGASQIVVAYGGGSTVGATINGSAAADTITGGAQADTILGGAGNDQINMSAGADRITLGDGNDNVVLTTAANTFTAGVKVITDFVGGGATSNDVITLDLTNAGAINTLANVAGLAGGNAGDLNIVTTALTTAEITAVGGNAAANAVLVVFNSSTGRGEIWFDADWSDTVGRTQIATLDNVVALVGVTSFSAVDGVDFTVS
jgi:hypothetical protein